MAKLNDQRMFSRLFKAEFRLIHVEQYAPTSRMLHWLVAALVFVTWPLGLAIGFASKEASSTLYMLHESLGFLVLWFMLLRMGNRMLARPPRAEGLLLERAAASLVHRLLYLFLVAMPVTGFLATNAHGFPLEWFGLFSVWSPLGKEPGLAQLLSNLHTCCAWILFGLLSMHLGAVLLHHVLRKDQTLFRIL